MKYIAHKPRPTGDTLNDTTPWLVLEDSPSFYIVYKVGDGVSLKYKRDYEIVEEA